MIVAALFLGVGCAVSFVVSLVMAYGYRPRMRSGR